MPKATGYHPWALQHQDVTDGYIIFMTATIKDASLALSMPLHLGWHSKNTGQNLDL